ncbi:hypothetical protein BU204_37740, partial [Actinophytocola xanthii]
MTTGIEPTFSDGRVMARPADPEPFLLRVEATEPGVRLDDWIRANHERLTAELYRHGALHLRGFAVHDPEEFGAAARAFSPQLLDYVERAAPRTEVADKVFTSTELSEDQWIAFHHERLPRHPRPPTLPRRPPNPRGDVRPVRQPPARRPVERVTRAALLGSGRSGPERA